MACLVRLGLQLGKMTISCPARSLLVTPVRTLKEIHVKQDGSDVFVSGVTVPSPRTELLVRAPPTPAPLDPTKHKCYMCDLTQQGLDVKHTDVLILSQFLRSDGCILPRRITGLCNRQQKRFSRLIKMAQKAGLMINMTPAKCKKDPTKRFQHKAFNTYFDESTIFAKKPVKWIEQFRLPKAKTPYKYY